MRAATSLDACSELLTVSKAALKCRRVASPDSMAGSIAKIAPQEVMWTHRRCSFCVSESADIRPASKRRHARYTSCYLLESSS